MVSLSTQLYSIRLVADRPEVVYEEVNWFQVLSSFPTGFLYLFIGGMILRMMVERLNGRPGRPRDSLGVDLTGGHGAAMVSMAESPTLR